MKYELVILIKAALGLSLSHFTPNVLCESKIIVPNKRAQSIQHSLVKFIGEAQREKHKLIICYKRRKGTFF